MITEAIVLAGGFGTRLQKVLDDVPKPMAPINGRPFLEYQLNYLKSFGITRVILSIGYLSHQIQDYFGDIFNNLEIDYAVEKTPLGTGGGIKLAFEKLKTQEALVVNGDTIFEVDIKEFYALHNSKNSLFSLALRKLDDVTRYGSVLINDENQIYKFAEKGINNGKGEINGGVYIIHSDFFKNTHLPKKFSLEKDVFENCYKKLDFYGFPFSNYFLDIGIPDDFEKAQYEFPKLKY
jgi:D-glycero-alpha-D-manno-heptose 1-phosphate guanylyltransferase